MEQNQKISYETHCSVVYKDGKPSQMATLNDMLLAELIKIGDTIEFTFKGNTFTAKILRGGLIGKCQQQTLHEDAKNVLANTVGFSSLTAWTESCLQDLLEEYYTRYSSWKRVYHRESKRSLMLGNRMYHLTTKKPEN